MIIKKYSCKRFAGIKDQDINFEDHLNVILGPNEAGKSTLVEGLYSVLFKSSKLGYKKVEDIEFRDRFMPIQAGDSIDGEVIISDHTGDYRVTREWGTAPFSRMILPDSQTIKNEESIADYLKDVLVFGEGTYSSIVFSKQLYIKSAIEKIIQNKEAKGEVSSLLRKVVMELDGVSLDDLNQRINDEISRLLKHWDLEKNYPENNKGISNPYKVGNGEIIESFYTKENQRLAMKESLQAEALIEKIYKDTQKTEATLKDLADRKASMEIIEGDVVKRAMLEPQIKQISSELKEYSLINQEWPQCDMRLDQLAKEIAAIDTTIAKLEAERILANQVSAKNNLEEKMTKINDLNKNITETKRQIAESIDITKEDIESLDKNYHGMLTSEAKMKAGVMIGKLNRLPDGTTFLITKDLEEPVEISAGESFQANGYIKLESKDLIEIELKSGDLDFSELRNQYMEFKANLEALLTSLKAASVEEAKLNKERLDTQKRIMEAYIVKVDEQLNGETLDSLVQKIAGYGDLSQVRSLAEIDAEIKKINRSNIDVLSEQKSLSGKVQIWCEKYGNVDGLLDKIIEIRMSLKECEAQLKPLAPLPSEYDSADSFRQELSEIRKSYESTNTLLNTLRNNYLDAERKLPELTYEELSQSSEEEEALFQKRINRARKLLMIKAAFDETRRQMDTSSFTPVIQSFSQNLALLTNGSYQVTDIDNDFALRLEKDKQVDIPVNLLSAGTYDSVALALRLALLDNILGESKGFLILDDCLVDLDPDRKEKAAELIKNFANRHQVIFTTCSPETAGMLGGNLIKM